MEILTDACLALLAAVGVWTLGQWFLGWLLADKSASEIWMVVRVQGSGDDLEQTLRGLRKRPYGQGILMVDCGLNEHGRVTADALVRQEQNVWLCRWEQAGTWMKEAEAWTKQGNSTK